MSLTLDFDAELLSDLMRIIHAEHWNPHHFLGLHSLSDEKKVIRIYRPGAKELYLEVFGKIVAARKIHEAGVFDFEVSHEVTSKNYRVYHQNGLLAEDPYSFLPTWGELDGYLFSKGVHYQLYNCLGAHETTIDGVKGVKFAVWAPSAMRVSLVADFNFWDGRVSPMRSMGASGIWELFIPGLQLGERYKFEIKTQQGELIIKADPFAKAAELRPLSASVVTSVDKHLWQDSVWQEQKKKEIYRNGPLLIYELHLGSWKLSHGNFLNYRTLAVELAEYCKSMGYTHIEIMPILEHPLDESWGYQVSGFYAPTSRFGTTEDFQFFIDYLHQQGLGVLLDWVPGHFPTDAFSLARFDGSCLYEHEDPREGYHPHWNTLIFNFGRHEVSNFLIANALFWLDKMHIDGLRVDAVASMLYRDYGRNSGEWIPNRYGGNENLEAIEFLKHLNAIVHEKFPETYMIAEESTSFTGVTHPVESGGLGFDFKWNMGWMNDTLRYFQVDPLFRRYHHNELTFGLLYAFSERFILVLSHDEVVHGKNSLLSKMPGDYWQQFANLRLLLSYLVCQPGKKMLFMGGEIGQFQEWYVKEEIHWHLLQYPAHNQLKDCVKALNHFYLNHPPLWTYDFDYRGFEWVDFSDVENSVISYRRKGGADYELLCVHHFTPSYISDYKLSLPMVHSIKEVFNTDALQFGGSGKINEYPLLEGEGSTRYVVFHLAPLATLIFEIRYA